MPSKRGRNDAAETLTHIIDIASNPETYKQRLVEFEQRQDAAVEAEAAASARIEEAARREAEIAALEVGLQAQQALVDRAIEFKAHCQELWREIEAERLAKEAA